MMMKYNRCAHFLLKVVEYALNQESIDLKKKYILILCYFLLTEKKEKVKLLFFLKVAAGQAADCYFKAGRCI